MMQNTVGKLLDNLLPSTIGIYRAGIKTFANAAVIATEVYYCKRGFFREESIFVIFAIFCQS